MNQYRKLIAALVGAALTAVSLGLAPEGAEDWLTVAISFLTAYGVYRLPNESVDGYYIEGE